jgi:hypothetical protein
VWISLERVPTIRDTEWAHWISSIAVSILAIRFLGDVAIVNAILLPYSVLGVALTSLIPFVVYFFVVKDFKKSARKMAWILFAVIFFALWISRNGATIISPTTKSVVPAELAVGKFAWIYLITGILSLVMLLADGTIQRMMRHSRAEDDAEYRRSLMLAELREEWQKYMKQRASNIISDSDLASRKDNIIRRASVVGITQKEIGI